MTLRNRWLIAAAALAAALAAFFISRPTSSNARLLTDDADVLRVGAKVYQAHCASCHGARLEGQANWREKGADGLLPAPPHDASGHTWHHPDDVLFRITKQGVGSVANIKDYKSAMPAFDGVLTDAEIIAALSWIKALWPADVRAQQEKVNKQYAESRGPR
jgi:mono/diheme cytochrome c family protein